MAIMTWNPSLATGIDSVDYQHQQLIQCINDLFDAIIQKKDREVTGRIISSLTDYTQKHFAYEELWFSATQYPDAAAHLAEHQKLIFQLNDIATAFAHGKDHVDEELMYLLRTWLMNHILQVDKQYVPHMQQARMP